MLFLVEIQKPDSNKKSMPRFHIHGDD